MPSFAYHSYLHEAVNQEYKSYYQFTNLSKKVSPMVLTFEFAISPDSKFITDQAKCFASSFSGLGVTKSSYFNYAQNTSKTETLLENVYKYSYYKAVYLGVSLATATSSGLNTVSNSKLFLGHHTLLRQLATVNTSSAGVIDSLTVNCYLYSDFDILSLIREEFPEYFDVTGRFNNPEYESVLEWMSTNGPVEIMSIPDNPLIIDHFSSPLGNMSFSKDMLKLNFLHGGKSLEDPSSFYWGKACCISTIREPVVDYDDSVYSDILVDEYDKLGISLEVRAITGFNPNIMLIMGSGLNGRGSNPNSKDHNPSGGNNPDCDDRRRNKNRKPKTKDINKLIENSNKRNGPINIAKNFLNRATKVTKRTIDLLNGNEILNAQTAQILYPIIEICLARELSNDEKRELIGKRVLIALGLFGLNVNNIIPDGYESTGKELILVRRTDKTERILIET